MIYLKVVSRPFLFLVQLPCFTLSLIQVHFLFSKTTVEFTRPNQFKFRHIFLYEHEMQHWNFYLSFTYILHMYFVYKRTQYLDQKLFIKYEFYCGFSMAQRFFGKVMAMIGLKFFEQLPISGEKSKRRSIFQMKCDQS